MSFEFMPHHICQTSNAPIFEKKPLKSSIHQWKICVPLSSFLEPVIANMSHILKHSYIISNSYQVPTLNFKHTTIENLLVLSSNHIRYYLQLCNSFPFFANFSAQCLNLDGVTWPPHSSQNLIKADLVFRSGVKNQLLSTTSQIHSFTNTLSKYQRKVTESS